MTETLGASLTTAPPVLPEDAALALLDRHWGLSGSLTPLTSERDQNFRVETGTARYVLKLANPAEPAAVTRFQNRALLHLEGAGLPLPRVIPALGGATEVATPFGLLRLITWLEGQPLAFALRSDAQRAAVGDMDARITLALWGFRDPEGGQDLQWDIRHAARLRPLLPNVPADLRPLCAEVLDRFEAEALPRLPDLRWQVVHNDLNPHNVLVDPTDPVRVTGVLDFGDMVETPLVCDMAVAASYQVDSARPLESLAAFARAYEAVLPLTPLERLLFPLLTATRMLTSAAISSTRALRYPDNAAYILRNLPSARAGLAALSRLDTSTLWSAP